jgi:predicted transcriptional regulator
MCERPVAVSQYHPAMSELVIRPDSALFQALHDLADAQDLAPEDVALDALRRRLHEEGRQVRAVAERLAAEHAELLRRLGE